MDEIISRISIYDVLGVFGSGLIAVVVMIFLKVPISFNVMNNNTENTICFLTICYLAGMVLQKVGSLAAGFTKAEERAVANILIKAPVKLTRTTCKSINSKPNIT